MIVSELLPATISQKTHAFTVDMVVLQLLSVGESILSARWTLFTVNALWFQSILTLNLSIQKLKWKPFKHIKTYTHSHTCAHTNGSIYHNTRIENRRVIAAIVNVQFHIKMNEWIVHIHTVLNTFIYPQTYTRTHWHVLLTRTQVNTRQFLNQQYETVICCCCW